MVGSYFSMKWPDTNWTVSADLPTPPDPSTTTLNSFIVVTKLQDFELSNHVFHLLLTTSARHCHYHSLEVDSDPQTRSQFYMGTFLTLTEPFPNPNSSRLSAKRPPSQSLSKDGPLVNWSRSTGPAVCPTAEGGAPQFRGLAPAHVAFLTDLETSKRLLL